MSGPLEDVVKRWTAKRNSALVIEIIQGKTNLAEASRGYDLSHPRSRVGLMMPGGAWRMRCGQTRSLFARNTRSSFATWRRPAARHGRTCHRDAERAVRLCMQIVTRGKAFRALGDLRILASISATNDRARAVLCWAMTSPISIRSALAAGRATRRRTDQDVAAWRARSSANTWSAGMPGLLPDSALIAARKTSSSRRSVSRLRDQSRRASWTTPLVEAYSPPTTVCRRTSASSAGMVIAILSTAPIEAPPSAGAYFIAFMMRYRCEHRLAKSLCIPFRSAPTRLAGQGTERPPGGFGMFICSPCGGLARAGGRSLIPCGSQDYSCASPPASRAPAGPRRASA